MFRTGLGIDNHRLVAGRPLYLGGVLVESPVGADAHSDGDVLLHALCDALYGAVGGGDIGERFPDGDPRWKNQPSRLFLEDAAARVKEAGYALMNVDATVILEEIKLGPTKKRIAEKLREILQPYWSLAEDAVNVKAKTNERCDAAGRGEAIAAHVAVLVCSTSFLEKWKEWRTEA